MDAIKQIWAIYDTDTNGYLEGEELKKFLDDVCEADPTLKGKQADLQAIVDGNGDGKLTMKELMEIFSA